MALSSHFGLHNFRNQFQCMHKVCIDSGCNFIAIFFNAAYFPAGVQSAPVALRGVTGPGASGGSGTAVVYAQATDGTWCEFVCKGAAYQPHCPVNIFALDAFHFVRGSPTAHEVNFKREKVLMGGDVCGTIALPRHATLRLHFLTTCTTAEFLKLNVPLSSVKRCCF